jgi:hypothetical protein
MKKYLTTRGAAAFLFSTSSILLLFLISFQANAATGHLGQDTRNHVTLVYLGDNNSVCPANPPRINKRSFYRVDPWGNIPSTKFKIPKGKELVITDVTWNAPYSFSSSPTPLIIGDSAVLKLGIHKASDGSHIIIPFESRPVPITTENHRRVGSTEFMASGFRVGHGRILCAIVDDVGAGLTAGKYDPSLVTLHGYLINSPY